MTSPAQREFEAIYRPIYEKEKQDFPEFKNGQYLGLAQLQWDGFQAAWKARGDDKLASEAIAEKMAEALRLIASTETLPYPTVAAMPYNYAIARDALTAYEKDAPIAFAEFCSKTNNANRSE